MAPLTKICYGSDGYKVPEIIYTSAKLGKQAVASVLAELVSDGMLTQCDAESAAGLILVRQRPGAVPVELIAIKSPGGRSGDRAAPRWRSCSNVASCAGSSG